MMQKISVKNYGTRQLPSRVRNKNSRLVLRQSRSLALNRIHFASWHGMFGHKIQMSPLAGEMNKKGVIKTPTFSLLGHDALPSHQSEPAKGLAEIGLADYTVNIACQLVAYINAHSPMDGPLVLAAHSMGGAVLNMLLTAMNRREELNWLKRVPKESRSHFLQNLKVLDEHVRGAVFIEPGPCKGAITLPTAEVAFNLMAPVLKAAVRGKAFCIPPSDIKPLLLNAHTSATEVDEILKTFRWQSSKAAWELATSVMLGDLGISDVPRRMKYQILGGDQDRVVPPKAIYKIAHQIRNSEVSIIPGVDHWMPGPRFAHLAVERILSYIQQNVSQGLLDVMV